MIRVYKKAKSRLAIMTRLLRHIVSLEKTVGAFAPKGFFTPQGGRSIESIRWCFVDDGPLQELAHQMACFINMPFFKIRVKASQQKYSVAGHIEGGGAESQNVFISFDPELLRFPEAAMKVMAHEISHKYLGFHRLALPVTKDDEERTDIASIYLGFGKYVLNGTSYSYTYGEGTGTTVKRTVKTGYLDFEQCAFVYDVVCKMKGVGDDEEFSGLNSDSVKCIRRVRKRYAICYPPNNLDTSQIKDKIAYTRSKLEQADLELCNIDKIKMLFPGALATKNSEINSLRTDVVKSRCALRQVEDEVDAPIGRVTYPSIAVWAEDVNKLSDSADAHLAVAQSLNGFVSQRVLPDVAHMNWDSMASIIVECPKCAGRMRLPTGKAHIGVTCPKCKYNFDYSTICLSFEWVPPPPFKEHRKPWLIRKVGVVFGAMKRKANVVPAGIWLLAILAGAVVLVFALRPLIRENVRRMASIQSEKRVAEYRLARQREQANEDARIAAEKSRAEAYKRKLAEDATHEKMPYPESGKVRILDEDKFCDKLKYVGGEKLPLSPFKITTPEGYYYLIKLVESGSKTPIMDIFCHPGETTEAYVPDGDYEARMAIGKTWYGYDYRFGAFTAYQKMDTILHFKQGNGHHVTLEKVAFGNLSTEDIDEEDF